MRLRLPVAAAALALMGAAPAYAGSVTDPVGDFLPTYTAGPQNPDLDVTSFSVNFDAATQQFTLGATLAGAFDFSRPNDIYVIGVNTGTGTARPFANVGQPNVIFNQAIVVRKNNTVTLGANTIATANLSGNSFNFMVPLSLFPTTGFAPERYGWNLWPRVALGNNNQISDFAPNNAMLTSVPEPASWAMMIAGFGMIGAWLRRRTPVSAAA